MVADLYTSGMPMDKEDLTNPRALAFVEALRKCAHATIVQAVRYEGDEQVQGVEFDVRPAVPQDPVADIRKSERLCVVFRRDELVAPIVLGSHPELVSATLHWNTAWPLAIVDWHSYARPASGEGAVLGDELGV